MSLLNIARLANFGDTGFGDSGLDTVVRIKGIIREAGNRIGLYAAMPSLG